MRIALLRVGDRTGDRCWLSWLVALPVIATAAGCQSPAPRETPDITEPSRVTVEAHLDQPFTLGVGETATLAATRLSVRFRGVPSDSRCPVDVTCVWEGDAAALVETVHDGVEQDHQLHLPGETLGPRSIVIDGYRLTFEALEPAPRTEKPIAAEAYRATFRVVAGS